MKLQRTLNTEYRSIYSCAVLTAIFIFLPSTRCQQIPPQIPPQRPPQIPPLNEPDFNNPRTSQPPTNYDPFNRGINQNQPDFNLRTQTPNYDPFNRGIPNQGGFQNQPDFNLPPNLQSTGNNYDSYSKGLQPWNQDHGFVIREATYFIVASRMVRPGQLYRVAVLVLRARLPLTVKSSISRNGVELTADVQDVKEGIPETLLMRVPTTSVPGTYKLRIEGTYDGSMGGLAFVNETIIKFSQRSMTIFVQTDKPVYIQGQTVRFRTIPINTELRAFNDAVDVYMLDPNRRIMRRWLSRQSNFGTVSLDYKLSDQPVFGEWTIQVTAQGQVEETQFLVEEYYQYRFEVNVTMPAFFFDTDEYIYGKVAANYTSGAPVRGNLTLKATVVPLRGGKPAYLPTYRQPEKYFNFDEKVPFWYPQRYNYWDPYTVPHLKFFNGVYEFRYPISELESFAQNNEGLEVRVTATVGERFLDEVIEGYSVARVYRSAIKVAFLGGSPQVFKPGMPFTVYLAVSYQDGSPLSPERLKYARMEVRSDIIMYGGGRRSINTQTLPMSSDNDGIWEMPIDLKYDLGLENNARARETLNTIQSMKISASFIDSMGDRANSELLLVAHFSPSNHQMKVSTSTRYAKVGEYVIFHVRSNFFIEFFNFIVMSKGIILLTGREVMQSTIQTFAVTLSAEMAPVATIMVYHVGRYGDVVADSLTFPVNGISRNNFTVYINNRKARTGERVEVAIFGEPGAYVGLSGLDHAFYAMQADNQLTYDKVIYKMSTFDEDTNGTYMQRWFSREGNPDEMVSYPSSTYGIDANRTFEYAGLVVFSDIPVTRRPSEICNISLGFHECLNGRCYHQQQKCNGVPDCEDGADEAGCFPSNSTILKLFRKYRFNRIQRHYENVWLWKDINIGPHGRYIFDLPVPDRPAHWMVTAFSVSPTMGFGMIRKPLEYMGVLPFFMNVEMPTVSRQGEQVGIRCTVFNYMTNAIEATVVLADSRDYKFVHVEMNGIVRSYNPRTSFGEHQFFIYIRAQDAVTVHVPVVPTRLGDIHVTVQASTLIGKYSVTRKLHVEADGLPQYRHQSVLLDLSNRAYVFQYMHVNITETPIIPYDNDRYYVFGSNKARVSVVGDVVGAIFPTMPVNSTSLLELPMDCAEQNMFSLAVNIYTTMYMRLINQRNRTLEKEAFYHMNVLYQRQLSFMNPDGSFSLFRSDWNHSSPSVWLTSFCVQVFQEASFYEWENFLYIDPQVIAQAVTWLLRHQTAEGSFYEVTWFPDRKLNDSLLYPTFHDFGYGDYNYGARPSSRNISLTAHVLITLVSVKDLTGGLGSQVALAQAKAVRWLERNLKVLEDFGEPFDVAIVAYALLLSKASTAEQAFAILNRHARVEGGLKYWGKEAVPQPPYKIENQKPFTLPRLPYKYDATNIEATAYALLTYVARQELFTEQIVKWLNSQRLTDGGWASTQDTAIAMKALIEYTQRARLRDVSSLTVTVEAIALPGKKATMFVTNKNRAQLQSIEIPHAWGTVKVQANGAGYAILQMTVQYNVDIPKFQTKPPIRAFDLRTDARYHGRNQSHITYFVCQNWLLLNESLRSGMAVLDVTIPTGYIIQQQKLDSYILSRRVYNLRRARFQERKVLFYFDYLENRETCVNFTIERWYPVANMSRYLPIRVYDYYAPERFNETIFDTLSTYLLNICEVCGSSQCPYCPIYNIASKLPVPVITILISVLVVFIHRTRVWRI